MNELFDTLTYSLGLEAGYTLKYVGLSGGLPLWSLLILICLGIIFSATLYARESTISRGYRTLLSVLRGTIFGLVLFFLFAPVIGIERSQTIRPSVIVMVDRSTSMNIADPRSQPADLVDAALAVGTTAFAMPREQEAMAKAHRGAIACATAMKQLLWADVLAVESTIEAALSEALQSPASEGTAEGGRPDTLTRAIKELSKQQKELRGRIEEGLKDMPMPAERVLQLRESQESIRRTCEALEKEMASASTVAVVKNQDALPISRSTMAKGLLDRPEIGRLTKDCNVHYFSFGERLEEIGTEGEASRVSAQSIEPTAPATHGAQAIREAVSRYSNGPIAGVVLLTDGAFNDEHVSAINTAGWLKEQGVPLYAAGLGLQSPRDVGLRSLIVQDVVFPKDLVTARVQVIAHGYSGLKTEVTAMLDGVEVAKRSLDLTDDPQFIELTFQVPEGKGGRRQLSFSIPPQAEEVSSKNNTLEKPVRIIDQKIKVLFIEGRPRWEYRYLRVLLQRDPRLDVQFLMTQGDPDLAVGSKEYLARYPENAEDAFAYDLVILGDVPSWYFNRPQFERIAELVRDRGGSLMMLSGEQYSPVSYIDTPLAEMLPVRATRDYMQMPENVYPIATAAGKRSFAKLDDVATENDAAWQLVRPLHRVPRLDGSKPGASVLVELPEGPNRPEPYPLIAWQYFGMGKVMYVGTDQLWRLRLKLGDRYHSRFWGQSIQFLALSRLLGENKRIRIESDTSDQVRIGQRVMVHANVLDPAYLPVVAEQYAIEIERVAKDPSEPSADGLSLSLTAVRGSPGLFQGSHVFHEEGQYLLKAVGEDSRFANTVDVLVSAADLEGLEPAMQEPLLKKMSAISGGRYLTVREWPALPGMVQARQRIVIESKELDLWDSWPPFALLLVCAGSEWFLRRRFNLV